MSSCGFETAGHLPLFWTERIDPLKFSDEQLVNVLLYDSETFKFFAIKKILRH